MAKGMACAFLFILATCTVGKESVTHQNFHKQDAEKLLKTITELLEREDYFEMLQPYIDDDFEKLEFDVVNGLNADKLMVISHLRKNSRAAYLIAKAELLHQFREGVVHMETAYADLHKLFERDLDVALKMGEKKPKGGMTKRNPRLPKKALVAHSNPHAHRERIENVVKAINMFAKRYTDEYQHLFADV